MSSNRYGKNGKYKNDSLLDQDLTPVKIIKAGKVYSE